MKLVLLMKEDKVKSSARKYTPPLFWPDVNKSFLSLLCSLNSNILANFSIFRNFEVIKSQRFRLKEGFAYTISEME